MDEEFKAQFKQLMMDAATIKMTCTETKTTLEKITSSVVKKIDTIDGYR